MKITILLLPFLAMILSCDPSSSPSSHDGDVSPLRVSWTLDSISTDPAVSYISLELDNQSGHELTSSNWSLHYNQLGGTPIPKSLPSDISIVNMMGDYFVLKPMALWQSLPDGQRRNIKLQLNGIIDKMSETPQGVFIVLEGQAHKIPEPVLKGVDIQTLAANGPATPAQRYQEYKDLQVLPREDLLPFIPSPISYLKQSGTLSIPATLTIGGEIIAPRAIASLEHYASNLNTSIETTSDEPFIKLIQDESLLPEHYHININSGGIEITSRDEGGIFYAIQSLVQMMYISQIEHDGSILLEHATIVDGPRFAYRGLHLDVARNFHSKEAVMRILDQMAFFKLNKFQFHITDDEGWRLEIPELPELTSIGARRGYTTDERDHLAPLFGSGPDPDASYGSGHYTQQDYIDIIQHAHDRHIEVIPEIDVPGHARAAILSMSARYDRLMAEGKEAEASQYLLHDAADQSQYLSAQGYRDNVVCVCQEGTYNFMRLAMETVIDLHRRAQVPLTTIHVGGDEIPHGVWTASPVCDAFIAMTEGIDKPSDLQAYFFMQLKDFLDTHQLIMGGWEEVLLAHDDKGHNTTDIDYNLINDRTLPYVWNAVWGWGREDMAYKLANAGSKVIMCNSAAYYLDMAYDRDPKEIGLSWSGYSNTQTIYGLDPEDMFKRATLDIAGQPLDPQAIAAKERLTEKGRKNLIGIQAQLWSETVTRETYLEYLMFPKLLGFGERAWSQAGPWMRETERPKIDQSFDQQWNVFANTIGQRGLPMVKQALGITHNRQPQVGISPGGDRNIQFPGYQLD